MAAYHRLAFEVPADEEDLFSVEVFARGAEGLISEEAAAGRRLFVYCRDPLPTELAGEASSWAGRGIRRLSAERCEDRDWLAEHRAAVRPLEIGRGFLVDPGEPGRTIDARGRMLLRVPARRAFGTGSHESTRLVLEWLEELGLDGLRVLDLGCGSGILAMAATRLGAGRVVALDVDPVACCVALETLRLNDCRLGMVAGTVACVAAGRRFDLILANILPGSWLADLETAVARLAAGGALLTSGLLESESDAVERRLAAVGLSVVDGRRLGEWSALLARRTAT